MLGRLQSARLLLVCGALSLALLGSAPPPDTFRFVLLGDRTGETQPGVYEEVWKRIAAENPAFVLSVGDSIEGMNDAAAESEWQRLIAILKPFGKYPLYLAPGNHDIWSVTSERLYQKYSGRPPHYGFDYGQAHFTILDNSRSDQLSPEELAFLELDLKAHAAQRLKIVVSHRPSWLVDVALRNPDFPLHQLARRYGVRYVIAGHVHQMLHLKLDGVTYISLPSAGGHLRLSGAYQDGWFFGYALAAVESDNIEFQIKEVTPPFGEGRMSTLADWGMAGLLNKAPRAAPPK